MSNAAGQFLRHSRYETPENQVTRWQSPPGGGWLRGGLPAERSPGGRPAACRAGRYGGWYRLAGARAAWPGAPGNRPAGAGAAGRAADHRQGVGVVAGGVVVADLRSARRHAPGPGARLPGAQQYPRPVRSGPGGRDVLDDLLRPADRDNHRVLAGAALGNDRPGAGGAGSPGAGQPWRPAAARPPRLISGLPGYSPVRAQPCNTRSCQMKWSLSSGLCPAAVSDPLGG